MTPVKSRSFHTTPPPVTLTTETGGRDQRRQPEGEPASISGQDGTSWQEFEDEMSIFLKIPTSLVGLKIQQLSSAVKMSADATARVGYKYMSSKPDLAFEANSQSRGRMKSIIESLRPVT